MIKKNILIFLIVLFTASCYAEDITITVTYNNVPYDENLATDWGISLFIEGLEKDILFDTGGNGKILLSNMTALGIDPGDVDIIVLSHIHGDHVGGLWSILEKNNKISVYLPRSFPEDFENRANKICKEVISVGKPVKICRRVWSTGELGAWMKEQSLVIETSKGLVIITGCAHPGIVDIARFVKSYLEKDIYLVLGGVHLMAYSESQVKDIIGQLKQLEVEKVGPSHCTGGRPIELFKEVWGENFLNLGCGARIKIVQ